MTYRMKATAMIPDDLINTVKEYTQSATIPEAGIYSAGNKLCDKGVGLLCDIIS